MNTFHAVGRLGRDVEVRVIPSGASVAQLAIAVDTGFGERKKTLWLRGALWGKRAEGGLMQYLVKGKQVEVSGELSEDKWTGNDGVEKTTLELHINGIELVGGGGQQQDNGFAQQQQQQQASGTGGQQFAAPQDPMAAGIEDDIPF